jgi:hypothetical protein
MATKLHPGRFDCYGKARPNEEIFCLLDRDAMAPFLVSIWSKVRIGDPEAARVVFESMLTQIAPHYCYAPDVDKAADAMEIAMAMFHAQALRGHGGTADGLRPGDG